MHLILFYDADAVQLFTMPSYFSISAFGTVAPSVVDVWISSIPTNFVQIFNRSAIEQIYVRADGTDPVVGVDGTLTVLPNTSKIIGVTDPQLAEIRLTASGSASYALELASQ